MVKFEIFDRLCEWRGAGRRKQVPCVCPIDCGTLNEKIPFFLQFLIGNTEIVKNQNVHFFENEKYWFLKSSKCSTNWNYEKMFFFLLEFGNCLFDDPMTIFSLKISIEILLPIRIFSFSSFTWSTLRSKCRNFQKVGIFICTELPRLPFLFATFIQIIEIEVFVSSVDEEESE